MGKRVLKIADGLLLRILTDGEEFHYRIRDGLPADVKIVDARMTGHWQVGRGEACFLLESASWAPAPDGQPHPEIVPIITGLYPRPGAYLTFEESLRCPNPEEPASVPSVPPAGSVVPPSP